MSVCSGSGIVTDSTSASTESNRHSSTRAACSEKIAKLTPTPSQVAPSGYGDPGQTLITRFGTAKLLPDWRTGCCLHAQFPKCPGSHSRTATTALGVAELGLGRYQ